MSSSSAPILTAESLVQDCVGRYITTGRGALRLTNLINSKSYAEAWTAVQRWAQRHFELGNSFIMSPIGVMNQTPGAPPQFAFFQSFIDKFGLETNNVARDTDASTVVKMYTSALAKYAPGLERERLKLAVQHLIQRLGEIIANRSQCLIEFGFATLVAEDRRVAMVLHVRPDQDGLRNDAEDNRKSLAAIQHRQKRARYSYIGTKPREGLSWVLNNLGSVPIQDHDDDTERSGMRFLGHGDLSTRLGRRALSPTNKVVLVGRCPSPPRLRDLPEHQRNLYPPVLDAFSRTRAATFSSGHSSLSLSARIASYYTPEARLWSFKASSNRVVRLLLNSSGVESKKTPAFESIMAESGSDDEQQLRQRYNYYIHHGVDQNHIAPIRDEWIQNILRLLKLNLGAVKPGQVEVGAAVDSESNLFTSIQMLIRNMLSEVGSDYHLSVRRAIVDYVLRDPEECIRLKIRSGAERPVPDWGSCRSLPSPPIEWGSSIQQAWVYLDTHLHTMNPAALAILQSWRRHESFSLVWTPNDLQLPISIQDFEARQKSHLRDQIAHFSNDWMKEVEDILRGRTDAKDDDLFESLATLMTNLLRGVVEQSVRQLHQFLTRFRHANDVAFSPDQVASVLNIIQDERPEPGMSPIFAVRLVVQRRKIQLQVLPNEVESAVARVLDAILNGFDALPRVETKLYPLLDNPKTMALKVDDDRISAQRDDIIRVFRQSSASAQAIVSLYDEHAYLLDESQRLADWVTQPRTLNEFRDRIEAFRALATDLTSKSRDMIRCGMISLDSSKVNEMLIGKATDLSKQILSYMASRNIEHNVVICDEFKSVSAVLLKKPTSSKELVELVRYSNNFKQTTLKRLLSDCANSADELRFLFDCDHLVNDEVLNHAGSAFSWVKKIDAIISEADMQLMNERRKMEGQFEARKDKFAKLLDSYSAQIADLAEFTDVKREAEFNTIIRNLKENLVAASDEGRRIQEQDELLGIPISEFSQLDECKSKLVPFEELWALVQEFRQHHTNWIDGPVFTLNAEQVKAKCDSMWRMSMKLSRQLTVAAGSVAINIKTALDQFKVHQPLIEILCNPGMRPRHWTAISETVGFDLRPDDHTSLTRFVDMGLVKWVDQLTTISDSASKEYSIEKSVDAMKKEWNTVEFSTTPYRDTGTHVLAGTGLEDIQTLLDDHIVKTQTMKGSSFAKPFAEAISDWERWLTAMQDVIDNWTQVQTTWLYLEPIFSSDDIMKQMPEEGQMFKQVDSSWRTVMAEVVTSPQVRSVSAIPGLLQTLENSRAMLDKIQKGLNQYLETKRLFFPRFFFLSNDELLEILSETKDPTRVQPHLKKCFEGVARLEFQENMEITALLSSEDERLALNTSMNAKDSNGSVERWLSDVETLMFASVKSCLQASLTAYVAESRSNWVLNWPGQVVLAGSQIFWTRNVEKHIEAGTLPTFLTESNAALTEIVGLVRGPLTKLQRRTLGALVVVDVHARDTVQALIDAQVPAIGDFEWQSQLRYYWHDGTVKVRIVNAEVQYGYEYLGNSDRLVITPLTDRCYRTLMGAIQFNLGGAPEGPAGTGKTETVKDLAKAIAIQCVVFNCSDGLDYLAMSKFFKGLASSGAWACFDEFNRIDLEVLSVVAQQVLSIQRAVAAHVDHFRFEGTELRLRPTCNVFITMNPGYAGRSELPDNLKALFRTVAMMVPNYEMIAEITLYSFGFLEARSLARKIVATFKLCSEQLSSQDHYDYGMRAVKAVLTAAGNLKRAAPEADESCLMLRSITDVNLPKFLTHDIGLFLGIVGDLFPGVQLLSPDHRQLVGAIESSLDQLGLRPVPAVLTKILQLHEMILVRHGLMLVGGPISGKTSAVRALSASLGVVLGSPVDVVTINPKSITLNEIYGQFDPVSHEWNDGVLSIHFRRLAASESGHRKWVVFDGPVDTLWIENMNTVLDDNKKLCLMSGEIIQMSSDMNMIFEVADLAVASPATVSRCGMVYMESSAIGTKLLLESWLAAMSAMASFNSGSFEVLFKRFVPSCLELVRRKCTEYSPSSDMNLVASFFKLYQAMLTDAPEPVSTKDSEALFIFSLIWSLGGTVDFDGRQQLSDLVRDLITDMKLSAKIPDKGLVYDYTWVNSSWTSWLTSSSFTIDSNARIQEIIVPTIDSVRYSSLTKLLVRHRIPGMFVGPTGTGKTAYISGTLLGLSRDSFTPILLTFSAQTSAAQTREIIDSKMERKRKGVFGPAGNRTGIVFVDDLNMPKPETFGAQPALELLRQWLDHGGWYDVKDATFRNIQETSLLCAMGPAGGGRHAITPRLSRHFVQLAMTPFDNDSLTTIFQTILGWHLGKGFTAEVTALCRRLVDSTRILFQTATAELLPTPARSHYTFNLRDFAGVIRGLCMSHPDEINDKFAMIRLWIHEVHRVFADRLIDDGDAFKFLDWVRNTTTKTLQVDFDTCLSRLDRNNDGRVDTVDEIRALMFGNYLTKKGTRKPYDEVVDLVHMREIFMMHLEEYNQISGSPINLVLFRYALEHISRIARILKQPGGHGLLVGVGGTGRQSLTRLAAHVAGYRLFQIEMTKSYGISEWHEDLKRILRMAGEKLEPTVFLFTDSQIKLEVFLEDINAILNSGEVPNLFASDEKAEICTNLLPVFKRGRRDSEPTPAELTSLFVDMVRQNLHLILCMSPVGDALRTRLRMFPSFVNCCTIDWMQQWPRNALETVARESLADVDISESSRAACVTLCVNFHQTTDELAKRFKQELRRHYYVTPSSYLELIKSFKSLLSEKVKQIMTAKRRYEGGLQVLATTGDQVKTMLTEIEELRPVLIRTGQETDEMIVQVDKETADAEAIKFSVEKEEAIANEKAAAAKAIADECAAELAQAMPILESAVAALNTLTKSDLVEVKAMKSPPAGVLIVMEAVCVMTNIPPTRTPDATGKMVKDYWDPAKKKLLSDPKLLATLSSFDKDNIPRDTIKKIATYIDDPLFDPVSVKKASKAAFGLCSWVRAMYQYDEVANTIRPKREALDNAKAEYSEVEKGLLAKQAELASVQAKVAALNEKLQSMQLKKSDLEAQVDLCGKKLVRGQQLIGGLGGEKERWTEAAAQLSRQYEQVVGDIVLSSGAIAYLGAFTAAYRSQCIESWAQMCRASSLQCADRFNLASALGDPVHIRQWVLDGLPNDSFSIDNAIIIQKARRWPLMIDPQGQANAWIKHKERDKKLVVIKLTDADFARRLEGSVQFGIPVLLENVGEELDPTLEPILLQQTYRKGGLVMIKLGDAEIEYSEQFRFYITSKMRNPHYLPELSTKVTLLNFMITPDGLEDQLLGIVVAKERPELQAEKNRLIVQSAENKKNLKDIEDEILRVLSSSEGSILDDESAIQVLSASKQISNDIAEKQRISDKTEKEIDTARMGYKPVAFHSSVLFFCIADLANVDPMYQYSLSWFLNMYEKAIEAAEASNVLESRLQNLNDHFTFSLFGAVCRSLFEKDKLLFAFLLTANLLKARGQIQPEQWRMLLTGGVSVDADLLMLANPCPDWLQATAWLEIQRLSATFTEFATLASTFREYANDWKHVFDSFEPHQTRFPGSLQPGLTSFQKMLVLRCLRPDKIVPAVRDFIAEHLGQKFVEIPPFDLAAAFKDADSSIPLLFVLSPGSDPLSSLIKFAADLGLSSRLESISLGQGQGPLAASLIETGQIRGSWIVLQNCHLAISWMPTLERIIESTTASGAHADYRLWLTSYPSDRFPVSVLQRAVKMTNEPPKGLKANLLASYSRDPICDPEFFGGCNHQPQWASLLYGLCFFHALVQERRSFGPLGWNIPYEFNESDLRISVRQLHMFVSHAEDVETIPYKAIRYLIGQCNYGGRVTDDWDRRTLIEILMNCIGAEILVKGHPLSESGLYQVPELSSNYTHYVEHCRSFPSVARPEVFGLHDNADITKDRNETTVLLKSILLTQARSASAGSKSKEEIVGEIAGDILLKVPAAFDLESVQIRFPVNYKESMNTVLCQELIRYNRLIGIIRHSLTDLQKALVGLVVMSSELEQLSDALFDGAVPKKWLSVSYPTMKPLSSYITDLIARLHCFQKWIQTGTSPDVFWISGFFFTQSFLTGVLQNYARKHSIPIDEIAFDFECINEESTVTRPQDGALVSGLFLEGARWDCATSTLDESAPKVLFSPAPIIWLKPVRTDGVRTENRYDCPVYKTLDRRGTLSTTGHSTNFVMTIRLPTSKPPSHWVRRGVALLTQLND